MTEIFIDNSEIEKQKQIAKAVKSGFESSGLKPLVYAETYGCQQNEADTERILGACSMCGYSVTREMEKADLIIINTCAIREHAELKVLSNTGAVKRLKEANRNLIVVLCGCMAQEKHVREKLYKSYPYIDVVFGTDRHHQVPEIIRDALKRKKRITFVSELPHNDFGVISENMPSERSNTYKAWVSVMYGCNNYCSYCIVPYVRGRERSRNSKEIMEEINRLLESGCKDITLLGQNVNSYNGDCTFPHLLEKAAALDYDYRLRFMTSHPKDATKELIDVIASNSRIARHFHLPVQSGSSKVLAEMNRGYTREQYLEKAAYIKEKIPGIVLTTDIICGFPGETEAEFEETVSLVKAVGFDMIYTFVYSPRVGTKAEKMPFPVPHAEKVRRFEYLTKIQNDIALEKNIRAVGSVLRILSDGENQGSFSGRTDGNKIVNFASPIPAGCFAQAKITGAHPYSLDGEIINK